MKGYPMFERLVAALESIAESLADIAGGGIAMSSNATLPEPSEPETANDTPDIPEEVEEEYATFSGVNKDQIIAITQAIAALGDEAIEDVKAALADQDVEKAGKLTTKKKRDGYVNHLSSLGHTGIIETALEPEEVEEEDEGLI